MKEYHDTNYEPTIALLWLWYTCALRYKILNPVYTRSYNSALDQPKFTRCTLMEHKLMQSSSLRFAPENVVAGTGTRQK